ncbi:MAG: hypothetical protein ACKPKO_30270, partial [Candidatus Fonsibacter sp.]
IQDLDDQVANLIKQKALRDASDGHKHISTGTGRTNHLDCLYNLYIQMNFNLDSINASLYLPRDAETPD